MSAVLVSAAHYYAELAVSSTIMAKDPSPAFIYAYPWRDDQAELTWVVG